MVLTSWLTIQNQGLRGAGSDEITAQDLIDNILPEARDVNLFWDKALETVLTDHDWAVATKSLLIGTSTVTETPVTPVGVPELSNADTVRKYYMPVPSYDPAGLAPGSVDFEIVRVIRNSYVADWVPQSGRVYFYLQITDVNTYIDVIYKPGFAGAGADILFCRALEYKLAQMVAKPVTGKDNPRDAMLQAEYSGIINEARMRDNTTGDVAQDGNRYWFEAANGTENDNTKTPWIDGSGRIHLEV